MQRPMSPWWDCSSSSRTQRRTLELAKRIGNQLVTILVDSGSIRKYIDARVCAARNFKVETEDHPEELKMADGIVVRTQGQVQVKFKCGGYRRTVFAWVFPRMNK